MIYDQEFEKNQMSWRVIDVNKKQIYDFRRLNGLSEKEILLIDSIRI